MRARLAEWLLAGVLAVALSACNSAGGGAGGDLGAGDLAGPPWPDGGRECCRQPACAQPVRCGRQTCYEGTWCDGSGAQPVCRCGNAPQSNGFFPCQCVGTQPASPACGVMWGACG